MFRRGFAPLLLVVLLLLPMLPVASSPSPRPVLPGAVEVYDLSWRVENGIPIFFNIFHGMETVATVADNGYYMNRLTMTEHTSTHMDAPCHFVEGAWCVDEIPVRRLYGVAVVMDASRYVLSPNDTITAGEIRTWETVTGLRIPKGGILLVYTGWSDYWGLYDSWEEYMDATGGGFPGFSEDAADYLIERGVIGVGIDTLSIDPAPSTDFIFHKKLLATNAWALENVRIPREILNSYVFLFVAPMKIDQGSGAPTRVFAFTLGEEYFPVEEGLMPLPARPGPPILEDFEPPKHMVQLAFAQEMKRAFDSAIIYDLSWEVRNGIPLFFNIFDGFSNLATIEELGYYINRLVMVEHTSTHMDAPCHFVDDVWCVDEVPPERLISRAVVMDVSWAVSSPNDTVSADEVRRWEREANIRISPGDIVLTYTGWGDYWGLYDSWDDYMDATGGGFPGFAEDAAQIFVSRGVYGIGIDTLSIDPAPSTIFPFHKRVLRENIYGLENVRLTRGSPVLNGTFTALVFPFKVGSGSGGTTRIFLVEGLDMWSVLDEVDEWVEIYRYLEWNRAHNQYLGNETASLTNSIVNIRDALDDVNGALEELDLALKDLQQRISDLEDGVKATRDEVENLSSQIGLAIALSLIALAALALYILITRARE